MKITIYHNPRCSKSRKTLEIIESRGVTPRIVEYLEEAPSADALRRLAVLLELPLVDLMRTSEDDFADSPTPLPLHDDNELSQWLHEHPLVLQRPIVVDEDANRAVIGRPPENVLELLSQ